MKSYQWILFDADETLFHFDSYQGLKLLFSDLKIEFSNKDYQNYQKVNKSLWVQYQNGAITAEQLQHGRFSSWSAKLNIPAENLNSAFLAKMAEICAPKDGAVNLLQALKGKAKLGIITNGFTDLQQARLNQTGLKHYFDILVISEQIGIAKPHPGIFEHAFNLMANPARDQILMVGDTPESDILGGMNAGIDTCWLNAENKTLPKNITPSYQVASLIELKKLLLPESII